MALVGYSDSEGSDNEAPVAVPKSSTARAPKPGFQKVIDPSAPRKIKVDLPSVKPEAKEEEEQRPAKKARTGGLGGINSFLPAPKRTAEKKPGLGSGVNLRTGAEPAFSRQRVEPDLPAPTFEKEQDGQGNESQPSEGLPPMQEEKPKEVKIVGNAMRFKPLSVANKKQKKKPANIPLKSETTAVAPTQAKNQAAAQPVAPPPKKKVSLFSVTQDEIAPEPETATSEYHPILTDATQVESTEDTAAATSYQPAPTHSNPNSLDAIAEDLNLSASARRQLFGRNKDAAAGAKIMHFDMEQEYASNEVLRQQGQAQEHRAVKAIAPGKHSLQQLVNAASTQKEALEDAWAEGKRNKAEGGSKYGW